MNFDDKPQNAPPSDAAVEQKVHEILAEILSISKNEIDNDRSLYDLGLDSLDAVELVMSVESEFDIEISDDAAEEVNTVGDIIAYVRKATL